MAEAVKHIGYQITVKKDKEPIAPHKTSFKASVYKVQKDSKGQYEQYIYCAYGATEAEALSNATAMFENNINVSKS